MDKPVFEWDIIVIGYDTYGNARTKTPAKFLASDKIELTNKVREAFNAKYDDFRGFWSHDWTLNSVREVTMFTAPVQPFKLDIPQYD